MCVLYMSHGGGGSQTKTQVRKVLKTLFFSENAHQVILSQISCKELSKRLILKGHVLNACVLKKSH